MDYSETIEVHVYGIEVGKYSTLAEYMEYTMYQRSRSFFDFCRRSLRFHSEARQTAVKLHIEIHDSRGLKFEVT